MSYRGIQSKSTAIEDFEKFCFALFWLIWCSLVSWSCPIVFCPLQEIPKAPILSIILGHIAPLFCDNPDFSPSKSFLDLGYVNWIELSEMKDQSHFLLLLCGASLTVKILSSTALFSVPVLVERRELRKGWCHQPRGHLNPLTVNN